ncbi:sulfatase-like hydrolase/transferase [Sphingobacterium humi]|uniref:Sulfatase-like hydrolase/transferase n=1 Tax=Sphingobacterium humi TaxID=1796905 RepID=A0A6N8L5D9_9SPHI|nr:sulfatase-like hydrolase/transferase [Sphingobacterium humi]MVZ62962.1 sulfatase-like hydrolase/transferase [Sphingobacterium humi]
MIGIRTGNGRISVWYYLLILLTLLITIAQLNAQSRPNILWITIEDTSPQFVGCYGNPDARTPTIDRLAKEGVRFTNAFSTNTVCSPSRTTLITGVRTYENGTGHHRSKFPLPAFMQGFPHYMQEAGYYTCNNAKTDYNIQNDKEYIKAAWNESSDKAGWWNRKSGQPFFAVFNYMDSHQSRTMTDPYDKYVQTVLDELPEEDQISESAFQMPPFFRDSPEMRKQFARVYNALKLTDNKIAKLLQKLEQDNLSDSTIIFFFGDHGEGIPKAKTNGINLGYRVPFVVWFPPMYQHLSPWGTGVVSDELVNFEDLAPTLIQLAEGQVPTHMKGRTLLGEERSKPVSYLALSSDRSDNGIDMVRSITDGRYIYSRNYMPFMPQARFINYMEIAEIKQQMRKDWIAGHLNKEQQTLFEDRPAEFLFDTEMDTWELKNLVEQPAYQQQLSLMRQQLDQTIMQARDIMFLPEYELNEIAKTGTAYEYRLNPQQYPLEEIYAAAKLSGFRSKEVTNQQIKLLSSKNNIVRYWAAVGLRSQNATQLKAHKQRLKAALKDPYAPVRISIAAVLFDLNEDRQAAEILKTELANENHYLALMAINYLLYLQHPEAFAEQMHSLKDNKALTADLKMAVRDYYVRLKQDEDKKN